MPELPEVETICRGLVPHLVGRRLVRVEARRRDLRFALPADFALRLEGRRVGPIARRGKYGLVHLDGGDVLVFHLGMSGRLRIAATGSDGARAGTHDHVRFETDAGETILFHDPRRFGMLDLAPADGLAEHPWLRHLGPEPLAAGFGGALLARRLAGRARNLKAALMDQRIVAGLGNIYACEALYEARLSPRRRAAGLGAGRCERLAQAIVAVLRRAIAAGGSSLRDYAQVDGALGYFQTGFKVYDREGVACAAPGCGRPVQRIVQAGRATFYCGGCQR
ncbi:MAG: bifunctional DNA-formamidopyrimidine glycosylase/DNA-(apurinic or apyrimidinic site) lyase [Alphaproteobacteria bacterium]|nr:MAG: bifunctional DNA-formamidopyrimidine glycosylase/DNA-(apurinic or apyrimidinic site) lyase [Alphaproteobacteria bacterium]